MDDARYSQWRKARLDNYPGRAQELRVEIGGLTNLSDTEKTAIVEVCNRSNMAIYSCRDDFVDRAAIRTFAAEFGLQRADLHLCANDDGVSELTVASEGTRSGYVPYSNRSLSWHTDGYYNDSLHQVHAIVLHCSAVPETGGENALLDHEIAYIRLRDKDPRYITAFEHPRCMTIPANSGTQGEIRPVARGPVFSYASGSGRIHMRYSARKRNIQWRDDNLTSDARECLAEILADENAPILRYRLQPGEGLISNNVLHNRTAFKDGSGHKRSLCRARFFDRVKTC